jgi:hypothetical protein
VPSVPGTTSKLSKQNYSTTKFLFESTTKFSNLIFYKENVTKIDLYLSWIDWYITYDAASSEEEGVLWKGFNKAIFIIGAMLNILNNEGIIGNLKGNFIFVASFFIYSNWKTNKNAGKMN